MNIAEIAVVAIPCVAIGAFLGHTLMRGDTEARFNVSKPGDDAFTIARLTDERDEWREEASENGFVVAYVSEALEHQTRRAAAAEAENADLRIDIAAKAQRLAEAGLQSTGGIDPTVSA